MESLKKTVFDAMTIIGWIGIMFTVGWVGWISTTSIDHDKRIAVVETTQKMVRENILDIKSDLAISKGELTSIRAVIMEVRADQIRRQRKEP